jgi:hypothetical protein
MVIVNLVSRRNVRNAIKMDAFNALMVLYQAFRVRVNDYIIIVKLYLRRKL